VRHPLILGRLRPLALCVAALVVSSCGEIKIEKRDDGEAGAQSAARKSGEEHLQGIQKLAGGGLNRQGCLLPERSRLAWLHRPVEELAYRVVAMDTDGRNRHLVSPVTGRCLDLDVAPDGRAILYSSDHLAAEFSAPEGAPDTARAAEPAIAGWPFDGEFDLFLALEGQARPVRLTATPGYDAEASFSWQGGQILFTSMRGDRGRLELMLLDGGDRHVLLEWPAYVGGARLSPRGDLIVFQAADPEGGAKVGLYICRSDGGEVRKLSDAGTYNLGPSWHPGGEFVIYASDSEEQDFELFTIRPDGTGRERITDHRGADLWPRFTRDGRVLVWTSQRMATATVETGIFRAVWIP
jgi:TolB protein